MATLLADSNLKQLLFQSIDMHCHGVGRFDFTEISEIDLDEIDAVLAERNRRVILTLYLPKPSFDTFLDLLTVFNMGRKQGKYSHIVGFGLEGPLLASHGGTPEKGVWMPSETHWQQLANCGQKGLIYIIFSPDYQLTGSNFVGYENAPSIEWITKTLLSGGVLPAPGHFTKLNPEISAQKLQTVFDIVSEWGQGPILTDHLYNDMPHAFKHAWRTPEERLRRNEEIADLKLSNWSFETLEQDLGPIPATIIRNAKKGLVKICQNFDGEHVDLDIIKRTVELVGVDNMVMMTDSIESKRLAGRDLHMHEGSTLLYQDDDIVAAGSQGVDKQINNMCLIGLTSEEISMITSSNPNFLLSKQKEFLDKIS